LYIDDVDKARERILGNVSTPSEESNPFEDADLWRKMWELRTLSERITDPELLKSKFIRELTAEVVMKSKKALKEIGSALMTGDPAVVQNLIDKVEHGQLITLAEKMQRKTNRQVLTYTPGVENPEKYLERVVDALISSSDVKSQNYGQLLSQKISVQKDLQQKLWDAITDGGKYNRQGIKGMMQFAPEAIAQFNDLVDELISDPKEFRYQDEVYTIPRRTLRRLQKETEKGAPITTPYDSYLTSQTFDAAPIRTWAHTSQIMKEAA